MFNQINPKDFSSYEEYLEALKRDEKFQEMSDNISEVLRSSKTDEEYQKAVEALGFTYQEDEFCNRSYCQKNEICLWIALENFQSECDKHFFDGLLSPGDFILSEQEIKNHFEFGCKFPKSWNDEEGLAYKSILFALDLEEAIYHSRSSKVGFEAFLEKEETKSIFRNLYLFLLIQLKQPESAKKEEVFSELGRFLENNELLEKKLSEEFLAKFKELN